VGSNPTLSAILLFSVRFLPHSLPKEILQSQGEGKWAIVAVLGSSSDQD
jgi:hypothetical protein